MTQQEYAELAGRYILYLLYTRETIDCHSAEACNLGALVQEGLGNHDEDPQVPLDVIVEYVKKQMGKF